MKRFFLKSFLATALSVIFCTTPVWAQTQSTNKASDKAASTPKKQTAGPFHGKLAAMDKSARTITVGKRTFQVVADSKIQKNGKPATFDDGVVDQEVSGYFKTAPDGKLVATKVTFGPKASSKSSEKKTQK